jgi:glyoxylase-like metal-dependent hydrolase (beta-lactamase superfamily II)
VEIAPSVHMLPTNRSVFPGLSGPNVYMIVGRTPVLFDSGLDDADMVASDLKYVRENGGNPTHVILSHHHLDHAGGAARIKELSGASIIAHPLEAAELENLVDLVAEDGYQVSIEGLEIELIHTPGHCGGHLCAYLPQQKVLFSGDHILGLGTTTIILPKGDMAQYIASLRRLLDYDIRYICPGHGPVIHAAHRKIEELIEHRLEREKQVLTLYRRGLREIDRLVTEIYPELDTHLKFMARAQISAHLDKLKQEGFLPRR